MKITDSDRDIIHVANEEAEKAVDRITNMGDPEYGEVPSNIQLSAYLLGYVTGFVRAIRLLRLHRQQLEENPQQEITEETH